VSLSWRNILVGTVFGLVAAVALAAVALVWRLNQGPIPLTFLDPQVEATLSGILPGVTAHVERTELGWAGHLPELRVIGVTLVHGDQPVASFPTLDILPSLRALARGRFAVHRVSLSGVRFTLVRNADGQLKLGADRAAGGGGRTVDLSALLASGSNDDSTTRFLRRIRIRDAAVSLDDRSAGSLWRADNADLDIKFVDHGFAVHVAGALSIASPASGIVRELVLPLAATAKLSSVENDGVASVAFEANAKEGRMMPAGSAGAPLPLRSFVAKGAFSPLSRTIDLREFHAAIGSAEIDLTATVSIDDPTAGLVLHGELRSLPIAELHRLWPPGAAASTREWIEGNIRDGAVSRCLFRLRLPAADAASKGLAANAVDVRFDFQGLTVDYLRDLTPLSEARGSGTLNAERFQGRVTGGKVGGLDVEGGSVEIRFGGGPARLKASADVSGPSQEVLTTLDQPPLGIPERIGIPAGGLGGTSRSHVEVEMPLKSGLLSTDIKVTAKGELHDASLTNLLAGIGIEGADLTVRVDDRNVNVEGESALTGLPMPAARARVVVAYVPGASGSADRLEIAIEGSDVLAKAVAALDGKALRALSVARIRFGGNDVAAELTRREDGGYRLSIDGASVDLEPFLRERGPVEQLADTVRAAYDVDFRVQRVNIGHGVELSAVQGVAGGDDGRLVAFSGTGDVAHAGTLRVNLSRQGPIKRLEMSSDRAGELLKAVGMLQGAVGGQLELAATVDDRSETPSVDGRLDLKDIRVTQAPIAARVLSLGSLNGIASLLGGEGILISRAQVPLTWSRDRLDVREATAVGAIGITVDGSVDRAKRTIDLRGSVFPAYALNSALGNIPFIGDLLVGEKGGGVFGIAYRVSGSLDNPGVDANPLSALAPGMLRRMFVDPFKHEDDGKKEPQPR
jgi:AsmA-like protein/uncharacterized protein DUF3971